MLQHLPKDLIKYTTGFLKLNDLLSVTSCNKYLYEYRYIVFERTCIDITTIINYFNGLCMSQIKNEIDQITGFMKKCRKIYVERDKYYYSNLDLFANVTEISIDNELTVPISELPSNITSLELLYNCESVKDLPRGLKN